MMFCKRNPASLMAGTVRECQSVHYAVQLMPHTYAEEQFCYDLSRSSARAKSAYQSGCRVDIGTMQQLKLAVIAGAGSVTGQSWRQSR